MIRRLSCTWLLLLSRSVLPASAEEFGYLGVALAQLPNGVAGPEGAIIQEIVQDGPADRDGLRSGDVVVAVNDNEIKDAHALIDACKNISIGERVRLKVLRAGEADKKELTITVGKRPDTPIADLPMKKRPSLGIAFMIRADGRLAVAQFLPDSAAEQAGLKPGDVITSISGKEATGYVAMLSIVARHGSGDEAKVQVSRDGQTLELTVKLK